MESGTRAAIRAFSQPPWDSPLAAMEQNSWKDSSLSTISWNRLRAESMNRVKRRSRGPATDGSHYSSE